jgi:glycerophosphoryl diester phosphodiesterase
MNKKKIIATVVMNVALIMILVITLNKEDEEPASGFETHKVICHGWN